MGEKRLLYFALGVLTVVSIGAVSIHDNRIGFPDGTSQTSAGGRRAFYATAQQYQGGGGITVSPILACEPGFHMASFHEIRDASNLRYATDLEGGFNVLRNLDSGLGPPTQEYGWVRTGFDADNSTIIGNANCSLWSSTSGNGTAVFLDDVWNRTIQFQPSLGAWGAGLRLCTEPYPVWCVQD